MTSEMLWPAAAASSRGQGLQSALEQTFTKISCSFFDIELSKKNGKALKMRQYKNATVQKCDKKSSSSQVKELFDIRELPLFIIYQVAAKPK